MYNKRNSAIAGLVLLLSVGAFLAARGITQQPGGRIVRINGQEFKVEIADNEEERTKGLSGRGELAADAGMLFLFPQTEKHSFWMKDTEIPLDILWIKGTEIQEIATLYPPSEVGFVQRHDPLFEADKVLEVPAGTARQLDIRPGSFIEILANKP